MIKPTSNGMKWLLRTAGFLVLLAGIGLFADPALFALSWPWILTTLTSRAIGAWLIGIGVFAAHSAVENEYARIKVGLISYLAFGILEIIALLRYPGSLTWTSWSTWLYVTLIVSIMLTGLYSARRAT